MLKFIKLKHTKAIKKPPKHGYSSKNHVGQRGSKFLGSTYTTQNSTGHSEIFIYMQYIVQHVSQFVFYSSTVSCQTRDISTEEYCQLHFQLF